MADRLTRQQSRADKPDYCLGRYIYLKMEERDELKFLSTRTSSPAKAVRRCSRCREADSAMIELAAQQRAMLRCTAKVRREKMASQRHANASWP